MNDWLRKGLLLVVALLVGAAIGAGLYVVQAEKRARADSAALAEALRARLDSLARQQSRQADSIAIETSKQLDLLRLAQVALADTLREVRDGITPPDTTVRDSLRYWHAVADTAIAETVALRGALGVSDSLRVVSERTVLRLAAERDSAWSRTDALAAGIDRLRAELRTRPAPCRIAWKIPCPSRTTMLAVGTAAGYAIADNRERKRR